LKISPIQTIFGSLAIAGGALILAACHSSDDESENTTSTRYTVSGWVTRTQTATPVDGQDGVGTIYIAAFAQCSLDGRLTGSGFVPNADLSVIGVTEKFELTDMSTGTHHLAVFLDDNNDASLEAPHCVEVTVGNADIADITIELNRIVPSG